MVSPTCEACALGKSPKQRSASVMRSGGVVLSLINEFIDVTFRSLGGVDPVTARSETGEENTERALSYRTPDSDLLERWRILQNAANCQHNSPQARITDCSSRNALSFSIRADNKSLSVAMRVHNPDRSPFKIPLRARFPRTCSCSCS